jgi:hypothetical protein
MIAKLKPYYIGYLILIVFTVFFLFKWQGAEKEKTKLELQNIDLINQEGEKIIRETETLVKVLRDTVWVIKKQRSKIDEELKENLKNLDDSVYNYNVVKNRISKYEQRADSIRRSRQ